MNQRQNKDKDKEKSTAPQTHNTPRFKKTKLTQKK